MFSGCDYIMTPKSLSWIVITNLKFFTVYVEVGCFSNQHYFAFVKRASQPFITGQSASQNVPSVLHSDSFLNILHKLSIIIKLCHLTLHFSFFQLIQIFALFLEASFSGLTDQLCPGTNPYGYLPITFSHFENSLKRALLIQLATNGRMFSFIKWGLCVFSYAETFW